MITPITAVVPVDTVMQTAHKGISSPAMEQLTQKFDALMKTPQSHHTSPPFQPHEPNAVAQVMAKEEAVLRQSFADVDKLTANMDHMSTHELTIAGLQISRSMAMGGMAMQTSMGVAQSSSKALQSLLKNQ
jgi:type III secretion system HrpB2-like protein